MDKGVCNRCDLNKLCGGYQCPFLGFDIVLDLCRMLTLGEAGGRNPGTSLHISLQPPVNL